MDKCALCGAETQLYHGDVPVCLDCSQARDKALAQADRLKMPDPRPFLMCPSSK
jgi:hypothetical protein